MTNVPAQLIVQHGPQPGHKHELTQPQLTIGRSDANDIVFDDPEMSRRHAQIIRQEDSYAIEDLGSTNGTFVNGRRIVGRTPLHDGDQIDFGEAIRVTFRRAPLESRPTTYQPDYEAAAERTAVEPRPESYQPPAAPVETVDEVDEFAVPAAAEPRSNRRRLWLGCGCGSLIVIFLCVATLFFLDAYDQGRLLYCGPLRPLFEIVLGPLGFSPACAQAYLAQLLLV